MTSKILSPSRSLLGFALPLLLGLALPGHVEREASATSALHAPIHGHTVPGGHLGAADAHHGLLAGEPVDLGTVEESGGHEGSSADGAATVSRPIAATTALDSEVVGLPEWSHVHRCGHLSHCLDLPPPHLS